MKVLMLNYEYPPLGGGAANANKYILKELSQRGIEVDLVTSSREDYKVETPFENVRVFRLDVGKDELHHWTQTEIIKYTWKGLRKSWELKKENDYDLIHSWFGIPCGVMARLLREPYIVALRGSDVPGYNSRFQWHYRFLKPVIKSVWSSSEEVIPNSDGLKDLAKKTADMNMRVIPNGVDTKQFSPDYSGEDNLKLLVVARLVERKRVQDAIKALEGLEAELVIIGKGPKKEELMELADRLGVRHKVVFKGYVKHSELDKHYSSADVFVLPSLNEGMSNTVLEALASGMPIIVTETGGTEELVDENGFVVDKKSPDQIRERIRSYLGNRELLKQQGRASRKIAENMSWDNVADSYVNVYNEVTE